MIPACTTMELTCPRTFCPNAISRLVVDPALNLSISKSPPANQPGFRYNGSMRIFLTGHGGWLPNDGFFTLPPKTHVVFYTLNAKLMLASDVYRLVGGTYLHPPAQIIEPYRSCQNLTLYPDDKDEINRTLSALMRNPDRDNCDIIRVNAPVKLKTIINDYPGHEFVWACCRDLSLA